MSNQPLMSQSDNSAQLSEVVSMGFSESQAREALKKFNNNVDSAVNFLISNPEENDPELKAAKILFNQDIEMSRAIENSIKDAGLDFVNYEPLNPESSKRKNGMPVGLKNIGNTCYFNSLVQFYFNLPKLVSEILTYKCHESYNSLQIPEDPVKKFEYFRKKASISLVENLQKLLSSMVCSRRKYLDPSKVLHALVDDFGNQVLVGDQKDVGEFHMIMVARIEEGLATKFPLNEDPEVVMEAEKEMSPVRRKESMNFTGLKMAEHGIVSELFYAKQIEHLKVPPENTQEIKTEVVFGQIILDVNEKELYSAWDSSYHCTIDDYSFNDSTVKAVQEIWPKKFPGVLLFQIQRVKYDVAMQNSIKINTPFKFPSELYADRFLLENKEMCSKIREEMLVLKKKARLLEKNIEMFTDFDCKAISIETVLESVIKCLDTQENSNEMEIDGMLTPKKILLDRPDVEDLETVKKVLEHYKSQIVASVTSMQFQLDAINSEIENLYSQPNLVKHKYKLHSLLIHDGYSGSGHYYAFVRDIEQEKWRKYSDLIVSDVTEEEVFKDAIGGNGLASAYCLFYVREDLISKTELPYWDFDLDSINNSVYMKNIPEHILEEITKDNQKLEEEISAYQVSTTFNKIQALNDSRNEEINRVNREYNLHKNEVFKLDLINVAFHLKARASELYKKYLLTMACKEVTGSDIESFSYTDPLYAKLKIYYPTLVVISKSEKEMIQAETRQFVSNVFDAELSGILITFFNQSRFIEAFHVLLYQNEFHTSLNLEYQKLIKECTRALLLRITTEVFRCIYDELFEEAFKWSSIAGHIICHVLENTEYISKVAVKRLQLAREEFKSNFSREKYLTYESRFIEILSQIEHSEIVAQIDFEAIPSEIEIIKAKRQDFDPDVWVLANNSEDIAHRFVVNRNSIENSPIKEWIKLGENITKSRSYVEKLIKDTEKRQALIPKRN